MGAEIFRNGLAEARAPNTSSTKRAAPLRDHQATTYLAGFESPSDFGCGYGTFSLAAARLTAGRVIGLDIEPAMIDRCRQRAAVAGLAQARFELRDFVADGTGLAAGSADFVMLFNLLHAESPAVLLEEARRILAPSGRLAVTHWNPDPATPRGPAMDIRPRPEDCRRWMQECGFRVESDVVNLPPWHFGLTATPC